MNGTLSLLLVLLIAVALIYWLNNSSFNMDTPSMNNPLIKNRSTSSSAPCAPCQKGGAILPNSADFTLGRKERPLLQKKALRRKW